VEGGIPNAVDYSELGVATSAATLFRLRRLAQQLLPDDKAVIAEAESRDCPWAVYDTAR
jgi:hypothetical protein